MVLTNESGLSPVKNLTFSKLLIRLKFRQLQKPVEGSLTMAPKEAPKPANHATMSAAPITAAHYMAGQIMSRNDPTKPPGLAGQCLDDDIASEDELLDVHMRPRYHFWHGKSYFTSIRYF